MRKAQKIISLQKAEQTMNRICHLFGIKYPIIQGGMVWCSGW
ncbi:MAG TPA: nitronate monooxygenase, partial [Phocaeicola coprocola]|nr:nitronate monooxygenase [Phocaeicola coprocola]